MADEVELKIGSHRVAISNPTKVFYNAGKFTKLDVVGYYQRIAPYLLPHFRNRPVTLKRYRMGFTAKSSTKRDYGLLRHATFEGLRDDKAPREIVRER